MGESMSFLEHKIMLIFLILMLCTKKCYRKRQKQIDFAVNTAGISYKEPLAAMDNQAISESVNTNYLGMINIASLPYLKESKGQLLFFTSSSCPRASH
jgi:2-C-methyl-D-erythritol 4-phosphate cytidylyltransferase